MKRRDFIKRAGLTGVGFALLPGGFRGINLLAETALTGLPLSDPALQPKFVNLVPDALSPGFKYMPKMGLYKVAISENSRHMTGLIDPKSGRKLRTTVWGYGDDRGPTWPGRTFEVSRNTGKTIVRWSNELFGKKHFLPVDTSLHWCYSLPGYQNYSIKKNGVPIITHLHGGHSDYQFDGNPEFFYTPDAEIRGPQWNHVEGGFQKDFKYDNNVPAGNLWYHDHALGITRLNVYAGLAGFYFIRDQFDTGDKMNSMDLPYWPYEKAYAIQDRMFMDNGALFYPAFPGDPYYDDFIDEEVALRPDLFPGGGPTALAEFFGDHMVVNGLIWPKENVEPRNYRMHLLNGTDSRFMAIEFWEVPAGATDLSQATGPIPFDVIGSDQGLASSPTTVNTLLSEPGSRYDIIVDFKNVTFGNRVIMKNIGGDEPFGGDIPGEQVFGETDRIMAFDVVLSKTSVPDPSPSGITFGPNVTGTVDRLRKVALFEGRDEFGRLQPLLGTAEPTKDYTNAENAWINWPATDVYQQAKLPDGTSSPLIGPMEGSIAWHSPTTENPAEGTTEEWEIWNMTGDAHPVHLHLVHFEVLGRQEINIDSNADEDGFIPNEMEPADDGVYLVTQPTVQHNSVAGDETTYGMGFKIMHPSNPADAYGGTVNKPDEYIENTPKDMVTALPGQITRIKAHFDKAGRYVWHCHILSHEDHEMMRVLHVGPNANVAMRKDQLTQSMAATYAPTKFALEQNYPNPFNPTTNIVFQLPRESRVKLTVYDIRGREVKRLINNGTYGAGRHTLHWDGTNKFGRNVSSGTYIYRIKAGSYTKSLKMNLIR